MKNTPWNQISNCINITCLKGINILTYVNSLTLHLVYIYCTKAQHNPVCTHCTITNLDYCYLILYKYIIFYSDYSAFTNFTPCFKNTNLYISSLHNLQIYKTFTYTARIFGYQSKQVACSMSVKLTKSKWFINSMCYNILKVIHVQ